MSVASCERPFLVNEILTSYNETKKKINGPLRTARWREEGFEILLLGKTMNAITTGKL